MKFAIGDLIIIDEHKSNAYWMFEITDFDYHNYSVHHLINKWMPQFIGSITAVAITSLEKRGNKI